MKKMRKYLLLGMAVIGILGSASISQAGNCPAVSPCPAAKADNSRGNATVSAYADGFQPAVSPSLQPKSLAPTTESNKTIGLGQMKHPVVSPLI
ncbi:MAG: hypothetical protein M1497_07795 [Nitrospirae bacterium]|nr:hypothetical protein [Nitrospirota bacterium]